MLQRIQTVYLFLVLVFTLLFLFFPLGALDMGATSYVIKTWSVSPKSEQILGDYNNLLGILSLILAFVVMILTVYITLQYKNRLLQIKLGKVNILMHMVMIVSAFFYIDSIKKGMEDFFSYGVAIIFPLLSMILILMANRAIRKDEDLVRSADRLR
ncbi:MAG: DUF4293 domain-containing protein [Bacteroidales bacterium]|nr:DUF4293 domain-containing protein [Bacteroidales bacterium]